MISVVMPVYNGSAFLDVALSSIEDQHHSGLEVLLVDDGSTDDLPLRAKHFAPPVLYLRQDNRGPAAARNLGLRASRGELLAFLDADDRWAPGHLERLERALSVHPESGIAQGLMQQFALNEDGSEQRSGPYRMPYLGSCLFRRWVFDRCGLLDESLQFGEDYDLMFRCWEHDIPKCHVEEVSLLYRRHAGNMTRGNDKLAHMVVLKRRLERIRAGRVDPSQQRRALFQDYIGNTAEAHQWNPWSA